MRYRRPILALALSLALAIGAAACGDDDEEATAPVEENAAAQFEAGTLMNKIAERGSIKIGVKKDQPGIGFQEPGAEAPQGFDIEMAKLIAAKLGIQPGDIEWVETVSKNREPFLQNGTVDLVLASYSITDERQEIVGQAGPYYVTGQQLLVREKDKDTITGPKALKGKKVCSVTGSTSIKTVTEQYGADPAPFATYSECVQQLLNGQVDAVTTDGAILLGYAAQQPDKLEVVGSEFSEERYGIGYHKGHPQMCRFLSDAIKESFESGNWEDAFAKTLGESGVEAPQPPNVDSCPSA